MKVLRAAAIVVLFLCLLLAAAGAIALHNQARLIALVLERVQQQTGYAVVAANARLRLRTHLDIILDRPSIRRDGNELMRSESVHVRVSYHALIWNNGLPLRGVIIVRPDVRLPAGSGAFNPGALPRVDSTFVRALGEAFRRFTGLVERVTIADGRLSDAAGNPLLEQFSLTATPRRRHARVWNIGFIAPHVNWPGFRGLEASGRMSIETMPGPADRLISGGELWIWNAGFQHDMGAAVTASGTMHGDATFALSGSGELSGRGEIDVDELTAGGARLDRPVALGNCSFKTLYAVSQAHVALVDLTARVGAATVAAGDLTLNDPFTLDAALLAHLNSVQIDLAALKAQLANTRNLPRPLVALAAALISGRVLLEGATYQARVQDMGWNAAAFSKALQATARLEALSLKLGNAPQLPALSEGNAQLSYAKGRVTLTQGSASLGNSSIREIDGSADFALGHRQVSYRLNATATLDLDELYPAAIALSPELAARAKGHVDAMSGSAAVAVGASGVLNTEAPEPPAKYLIRIETNAIKVTEKDLPHPLQLVGGTVLVKPGSVELARVVAKVARPEQPGSVLVNGDLAFDAQGLRLHTISVELHQVAVEQWLPLLVDPDDIAARGPLGGTLTIAREPSRNQGIRANGLLTMGEGEVQLGFLRAPIVAQSATLSFDGRGLLLAIVGARLQGAPFDFSLGVEDLDKPVLRIVANAGRLDLEVMKFIRLPWAPSPPAKFFPVPVVGHIEAAHATLERLEMSRARCDFNREVNGDWRVRDFAADIYGGRANLEFSGRGRDDWINIKGDLNDVQVGPLYQIAAPQAAPPLTGTLRVRGDLWGDSNTDFFNTLAGTLSVDVTDGVLHKFALLSRILSFIDLKTWLSAKVPDPRINGVPFQTLKADFAGRGGEFYSDNLLLRGPVMNISALGHVHLPDGDVDMMVGMVPFKTVNWLMAKVPLIGSGLSSDHLVAAYFHVTGPLSNPHVVPKPITSVEFFLTNVLKVPLNILNGIRNNVGNGNGNSSSSGN
ncbi:MAG TPA: AsmA-like C-terminal region-containing protein [Candidatus Binataceae bacterium]|nr:AsmA-like C-terminal region-containing protein [Candidatus Binataceae bacterium]